MSDKFENVVNEVEETTEAEKVEETAENSENAVEPTEETAQEMVEVSEDAAESEAEDEQLVEGIVDEIGEAVEAVADGDENTADIIDELRENVEDVAEEILPEEIKKKSAAPIVAVVVVLAVLIVGIAAWLGFTMTSNKYNDVTLSIYGYTLEDMAVSNGMTVDAFKTACGLPEDMPADTSYEAAVYYTPVGKYAELYFGMDFESFKEQVSVPEQTTVSEPKTFIEKVKNIFNPKKAETITAETPWGVVLDEFNLGQYVSEGQFNDFKEYYGLDDTVTTETLYKDIRAVVEQRDYEIYQEQKKMMEAQQQEAEMTDETQTTQEEENAEEANTRATEENSEEVAAQ